MRSYRGDHTPCNDLIRATIVFTKVSDMARCLAILHRKKYDNGDPTGIKIVRLKNRYSLDYDAVKESAGYRDVCMNLQVKTKEAEERGVSKHYAELQLQMSEMYKAKEALGGHAEYQQFRNALGL